MFIAPQVPHMPLVAVFAVLDVADVILVMAGLNRFRNKAIS
jgi:hypothetical protein